MLADGDLGPDEVLLGTDPDREPAGGKATVDVTDDGASAIEATVTADGDGYLVVADALQNGWRRPSTASGPTSCRPTTGSSRSRSAPGEHTVKLQYAAPYGGAGTWLSAATAVLLCALVVVERWWRRRQRTSTHTPESGTQ